MRNPDEDPLKELSEEITASKYKIDEVLLQECLWVVEYQEGTLMSVLEVHQENAKRYRDCYIIHNSLIEVIRLINKEEDK